MLLTFISLLFQVVHCRIHTVTIFAMDFLYFQRFFSMCNFLLQKINFCNFFIYIGIAERVDYVPGSGREDLFPAAQLKLCDMPCNVHAVHAKLSLATKHIDKGCDRDTYSVTSQRKICGIYEISFIIYYF